MASLMAASNPTGEVALIYVTVATLKTYLLQIDTAYGTGEYPGTQAR